jgi:hypothetical protein
MVNDLRLLLLALWLGAAIFFTAVVAPNAFLVLRSFHLTNANEIAGTMVGRALSVVNISGFILSLLLLVTALALKKSFGRASFILQIVVLVIMAITTGVGEWVLAARLRGLRAAMFLPIDQVPLSDPRRVTFAALHSYSVMALAIAMIAGLIALILARPGWHRMRNGKDFSFGDN